MLKCVLGWCLPLDYQKLESPIPEGAVHVDIDVEILDILSINDKEFSITMSMYFSVQWQESRYTATDMFAVFDIIRNGESRSLITRRTCLFLAEKVSFS